MQFTQIKHQRFNDSCYTAVMDNGLTVAVYPMPNKNGIHAMLSAKIGSVNRDFMLDGRRVNVPAGIAHFLEHKLFENEQEDAFSLFARTGASANAYTSFERTCYLFSTAVNIEASLRALISFVTNPIFTKATVQKEQGIIAQEIKMYDDNAEWVLSNMLLSNLYVNHPLNEDIAGTVESIAEITPKLLYDCYNAFYRPSNMILSVAGNISVEDVQRICEEEYKNCRTPAESVELMPVQEPAEVAQTYAEKTMSVFENMFGLAYKEQPFYAEEKLRNEMTLRMLIDLIADDTSDLYRNLYDSGLANGMFDASVISGEDYLSVMFTGESKDPEKVIGDIKKEIAKRRDIGFDEGRFLECKRAFLGSELCSFDSVEAVAARMTVGYFKDYGIYDIIDIVDSISINDVENMLEKVLNDKNSTAAFIRPAGGEDR